MNTNLSKRSTSSSDSSDHFTLDIFHLLAEVSMEFRNSVSTLVWPYGPKDGHMTGYIISSAARTFKQQG